MGGELPHKLVLGVMTRTLISMMMKFCSRLISNMNFSFGEDEGCGVVWGAVLLRRGGLGRLSDF